MPLTLATDMPFVQVGIRVVARALCARVLVENARNIAELSSVLAVSALDYPADRARSGSTLTLQLEAVECHAKVCMINQAWHAWNFGIPNGSERYRRPGVDAAAIRCLGRASNDEMIFWILSALFAVIVLVPTSRVMPLDLSAMCALVGTAAMNRVVHELSFFTAREELRRSRRKHPWLATQVDALYARGVRRLGDAELEELLERWAH